MESQVEVSASIVINKSTVYKLSQAILKMFGKDRAPRALQSIGPNDEITPEVDLIIRSLIIMFCLKKKKYEEAWKYCLALMSKLREDWNLVDKYVAVCYFYVAHCSEVTDHLYDVRGFLMGQLSMLYFRDLFECHAAVINALLKNYLLCSDFEEAKCVVRRCNFPKGKLCEYTRYLFYMGLVQASALHYKPAYNFFFRALLLMRKIAGSRFRITVKKCAVLMQMLMGEVPEWTHFTKHALRDTLQPCLPPKINLTSPKSLKKVRDKVKKMNALDLLLRMRPVFIEKGIHQSEGRGLSVGQITLKLGLNDISQYKYLLARAISDAAKNAIIYDKSLVVPRRNNRSGRKRKNLRKRRKNLPRFCPQVYTKIRQRARAADSVVSTHMCRD